MKRSTKGIIHERRNINIKRIRRKKKNVRVLNQNKDINKKRRKDNVRIRRTDSRGMIERGRISIKKKESRTKNKLDQK